MFVWSKLTSSQWADAWEKRLAGHPNLVIEYLKGGKSLRLRVFCGSEKEAVEIKARFGGGIRKTSAAEWNKPAALPKPVKVRDAFLLTAETRLRELVALRKTNPGREIIAIPAEMAFGTGDHATTSTCLRLLVDVARDFKAAALAGRRPSSAFSVADLGTGTGVLAIAARKLGASEVYACDFDPFSVAAAQRNAVRNGTLDIRIEEQDVLKWKPRRKGYDLVLANMFSTVLIEAWPVIAKALAHDGDVIVSGILHSQAWDVFTAAAANGLGFTHIVRKGKWITARGSHFADLIAAGH